MAQLPLNEVLKKILELNGPDKPYLIKVEGNNIVATWNIFNANWVGITSINQQKNDYKITFTLDEATHEFDYNEILKSKNASLGIGGLSMGGEFQSGKFVVYSKETKYGVGEDKTKNPGALTAPLEYSFNNADVKKPIIDFLTESGWKKKKGFWATLFSKS